MEPVRPCVFIIRDGWGVRDEREGNAVLLANLPRHKELWSKYPTALVNASEHYVGLPDGQFGNSEVGHLNMGGGRVVYQDFTRISKSIQDGDFFENDALNGACQRASERNRSLHLIGLVSDGGVHSYHEHLYALLELARRRNVRRVLVHALTDGRDTAPGSAVRYVAELVEKMKTIGVGQIATVGGRYYGMDRDKRWDREKKAYDAIVHGRSERRGRDPVRLVEESYARGVTDEFIEPSVVTDDRGDPVGAVRRGDQFIFFNFRADRARQMSRALCDPAFDAFDRGGGPVIELVAFTEYDRDIKFAGVAYPPSRVDNHFSQVVSNLGLSQFKCAETEKYAHVTFFWNGGEEAPCPGEARTLIESPKVATYDEKPEMSARGVCASVVERIQGHQDGLIVVNFANPDMVGHTGKLEPTIVALEVVDECVGKIIDACRNKGYCALVTADHGNCETMIDPVTKEPCTTHTRNPVHAILVAEDVVGRKVRNLGALSDLAPTALEMMGLPKPREMTGTSILVPS
ncbi:MAG TPA: 2,3-bisphosphoglycerate-independent phosphoglycerate mutase [Planctomycetota bacterium]|nr:2,3-bisphosphoglycerate-independent phosphoglycerate mutase [Planctomycetota bacterium]